ncbi:MAG: Asp-tRNA(Asn)/Glu-tRNA(Gln) amidotransferase subunit GatC [Candidatus Kryptoniota bacterium]
MKVTVDEVDRIAKLAKLRFSEDEKEKFTEQFNNIISFVERLNELDTDNIEPLLHVIELENVFRDDVLQKSIPTEEILKNAPVRRDNFFKVPKVIEK